MAGIHLQIDQNGAKAINEYREYERIVGGDDMGKLFTPAEYEKYKKKMIPIRMKNRLYVSWTSLKTGIECKQIGPETKCFCQHRYKQHQSDFEVLPSERPIKLPCQERGCKCKCFNYIPTNGSQAIRCTCKHTTTEHSVFGAKKCLKPSCGCKKFYSHFACSCSDPCYNHRMNVETKEERLARGKPVGKDVPYKAMGGLTGFSSLADGYMRLDTSGIGPPPAEVLDRPIDSNDHPFLKMYEEHKDVSSSSEDSNKPLSLKEREERDMAFFEKRFQERLKIEKGGGGRR